MRDAPVSARSSSVKSVSEVRSANVVEDNELAVHDAAGAHQVGQVAKLG